MHLVIPKALKNLSFSGYLLSCVSNPLHQKHAKISTFQDTLSLGYPSRYTKSTQKSQLFRIPSHFGYPSRCTKSTQKSQLFRIRSHLGMHLVTPKAVKSLNFSGYPRTWVSMSLHLKRWKISTFQDTLALGYPSRYTKSTQKSQLFKIPSHLGIHLVTRKAPKSLNLSGYARIWVSISSHQKHSKMSTFQYTFSLGYRSLYTISTQKSQFFIIPSHLGIHLVTPKARKNLNFSGYPLACVFIWLHQKHSEISAFQGTLALGYPSRYTKSTQKSQLFRIPSHLGIHRVTRKAPKSLNLSGYARIWVSISSHQKHSKMSTFQYTFSVGYRSLYTISTQKSQFFIIPSHLGIHLVTPKARKNLNFSGYPLACVFIWLHQKHSEISAFQGTLALGYASRYSKSTQKSQLFRIPSHLCIHLVTPVALKNLYFSGYPLTWVSSSLHQKHSKMSAFQDTLCKFAISASLLF